MMIYVTAADGAGTAFSAAHELQRRDLDNCYVFFCSLQQGEVGEEEEMELRLDLMTACDCIVMVGGPDSMVWRELELARAIGMEVMCLENGLLRPFAQ